MKCAKIYERRWPVLITVGIGTFLSSLNSSIINIILPDMESALQITLGQSAWIVLIYLLIITLFLIPVGRISDLWGHRTIFLSGFVLFAIACVLCGLTYNYKLILVGRGIMAMAGAMINAIGPALISISFSAEQRGRVLGILAIMTYIGLALGPVIGGWLTEHWGWQVTFFVNVPFAITGLFLGLWSIPKVYVRNQKLLDLKGIIFYILGMSAFIFMLNSNVLTQYRIVICLILFLIFVLSVWMFIKNELKHPTPILNFALFKIRNFAIGTLGAIINYTCFFLVTFLLPYFLDKVLHFSPSRTGAYLTITPLVMTVCAPISGILSDRFGPRLLTVVGMTFSVAGLALFGFMYLGIATHFILAAGLIFSGMGTGTFAAPNNSAILGSVSRQHQGIAAGTLSTARYIGMMTGVTIGGSFLNFLLQRFTTSSIMSEQTYLQAFSIVMFIGAAFGFLGIITSLAMITSKQRVKEQDIEVS